MWVKVDDQFAEHPKIIKAGPVAGFLYIAALCYANRHLTDGFIPAAHVTALLPRNGVRAEEVLQRLCAAGLWAPATHNDTRGYQIHDYLQFQPSRKAVIKARKNSAKRQAAWRAHHPKRNAVTTPLVRR